MLDWGFEIGESVRRWGSVEIGGVLRLEEC